MCFGPGAKALTATFDAIKETPLEMKANGLVRQGDARVEYDLLRRAKISQRFGKFTTACSTSTIRREPSAWRTPSSRPATAARSSTDASRVGARTASSEWST